MSIGQTSENVRALQSCLAEDSSVYPEGLITAYFGLRTQQAVIRFQEKFASEILTPSGLTRGTGFVGFLTRQKLNQVCAQ
jgi:peptidoglycan hydrolase-like protein with peptidoglycan-binding domain